MIFGWPPVIANSRESILPYCLIWRVATLFICLKRGVKNVRIIAETHIFSNRESIFSYCLMRRVTTPCIMKSLLTVGSLLKQNLKGILPVFKGTMKHKINNVEHFSPGTIFRSVKNISSLGLYFLLPLSMTEGSKFFYFLYTKNSTKIWLIWIKFWACLLDLGKNFMKKARI